MLHGHGALRHPGYGAAPRPTLRLLDAERGSGGGVASRLAHPAIARRLQIEPQVSQHLLGHRHLEDGHDDLEVAAAAAQQLNRLACRVPTVLSAQAASMWVSTDSTGGFAVASSGTRMSVQGSFAHLRQREFGAENCRPRWPSSMLAFKRDLCDRSSLNIEAGWRIRGLAVLTHATTSFSPSRSARSRSERLQPAAVCEP